MNTTTKTILCLPMTALLLTTALAGPAAAKKAVPFKGVVRGTEDFKFKDDGSGILIQGSGEGRATHLGRFTATWDGDITFTNPDNLHPIERTFIAANGDELWSEAMGAGTDPAADPNLNQYIVEEHVITGGTGRFEGARGYYTVERVVYDVRPLFDLATSGSFHGTIIFADR